MSYRKSFHSVCPRSLVNPSISWKLILQIYNAKSGADRWLDFLDPPLFSSDGSKCLLRIPWRDGDAGYFLHVVWFDINTRKEIPITHGPFEVTKIVGWDQQNHFM